MTSQRDLMRSGAAYDPMDPSLVAGRNRARKLIARYNATFGEDETPRREILTELLGSAGPDVAIEPPFICDYGSQIHLGEAVYMNFNCLLLDSADITIGAGTLLAPGVQIYTATHPLRASERVQKGPDGYEFAESAKPVTIGENCWIGGGTVILPGVTIGAGTTIGAGSVVTKSLPGNVLAAGNPCRVIRQLED